MLCLLSSPLCLPTLHPFLSFLPPYLGSTLAIAESTLHGKTQAIDAVFDGTRDALGLTATAEEIGNHLGGLDASARFAAGAGGGVGVEVGREQRGPHQLKGRGGDGEEEKDEDEEEGQGGEEQELPWEKSWAGHCLGRGAQAV